MPVELARSVAAEPDVVHQACRREAAAGAVAARAARISSAAGRWASSLVLAETVVVAEGPAGAGAEPLLRRPVEAH